MKAKILGGLLGALVFVQSATAGLILRDVDGVQMVYDQTQDITWLLDANYASTSGYDTNGRMVWDVATAWASNLSLAGFDDWRLPSLTVTDTNNNSQLDCDNSITGGTDCGFNVLTANSELAYMFYEHLGNVAKYDTSGGDQQLGWNSLNTTFQDADTGQDVTFENLFRNVYWTGTEYAPSSSDAWFFDTDIGGQGYTYKGYDGYAWAVRDGDVLSASVPAPGSLALLSVGLLVLARRQRR
jgi:hypothetical protein